MDKQIDILVAMLEADTMYSSSLTVVANHMAFRDIVGLGWPVVPVLLEKMKTHPGWYATMALNEITGETPWDKSAAGKLLEQIDAWAKWGVAHGYGK